MNKPTCTLIKQLYLRNSSKVIDYSYNYKYSECRNKTLIYNRRNPYYFYIENNNIFVSA